MKNILFIIATVVALSSCSKIKRSTTVDESYAKSLEKTDSIEIVKTSEKVDTTVFLDPFHYDVSTALADLVDSSVLILDTPEIKIVGNVDKKANVLRTSTVVKSRPVTVKVDKSTETYTRNRSTVKIIKKDSSEQKDIVKTKVAWWPYLLVLLVLVAGYFGIKYLPFRIVKK